MERQVVDELDHLDDERRNDEAGEREDHEDGGADGEERSEPAVGAPALDPRRERTERRRQEERERQDDDDRRDLLEKAEEPLHDQQRDDPLREDGPGDVDAGGGRLVLRVDAAPHLLRLVLERGGRSLRVHGRPLSRESTTKRPRNRAGASAGNRKSGTSEGPPTCAIGRRRALSAGAAPCRPTPRPVRRRRAGVG